jgi:hypothetical protein
MYFDKIVLIQVQQKIIYEIYLMHFSIPTTK